jgi:acyl-CoA dehydrogenase
VDFDYSATQKVWRTRVQSFMDEFVYPAEDQYAAQVRAMKASGWQPVPILETLKGKAKEQGLWNLFMPPHPRESRDDDHVEFDSPGLSNLEYAPLAEIMGHVLWASEVFNCSAPDTGNMEVLLRYGTQAQKERWLRPLKDGVIRSTFLMTEPAVASSDATNIETRIESDGKDYVINGRKWWATGVGHPHCVIAILMGKTDPTAPVHQQQSQILIPLDTPGIKIERLLDVFGYDDVPHGHAEIVLNNVRVPKDNLLLGEGRGFEIAQGRLGPGRIHHCMRIIGMAEVALEKMADRLLRRQAFGKAIAKQSIWEERVAEARIDIEMARLLTLKAADMMDKVGNKHARGEIAMIKVAAPRIALKVIDDAIQAHGAAGVSGDFALAALFAKIRTLRLADGPDEVHRRTIARIEFDKAQARQAGA